MSYYATGSGYIKFYFAMDSEEYDEIAEMLSEEYDLDGRRWEPDNRTITFYTTDTYRADFVTDLLNDIARKMTITEGQVEYIGDDSAIWRHVFRNGHWTVENGHVEYIDMPMQKLADAFRAYVHANAKAVGPKDVLTTLHTTCGLSDSDLTKLQIAV